MTSTDIGAAEASASPVGQSLQRNGFGGWALAASTFGACNDQPPLPSTGPTTVVIDELMGDPLGALSASWGEWFEVHNYGTAPVDLAGWKIRSGNDQEHTIAGSVVIAPGACAVLGRSNNLANNGFVEVACNYFAGSSTTIWLDANDWLALRTPAGTTVDSVHWTSLPKGATRVLRAVAADNTDADGANWGFSTTPFGGDFGTPGEANGALSDVAPPVPPGVTRITFSPCESRLRLPAERRLHPPIRRPEPV
jgi:hypothetical protein